ncbi:MAG: homoserine kinase [Clostridia bacterium]|nr:homoserine kinase [Clostridia bacterium]
MFVTKVKVRVPATTANLGPGFDVLGMALNLYNYIEMKEMDSGLEISVEGEGKGILPGDSSSIVYEIAWKVFKLAGYSPRGIKIKLTNNIPIARGLGSSAAALVGGAVAANALSGSRLSLEELINLASEMEGHPDNVVPAAVGGFTLCINTVDEGIIFRKIDPPEVYAVAAVPFFELSTKKARDVLPKMVSIKDAVFNMGRTSMLVYAVQTGELRLLKNVMQDRLHQLYRVSLVPGMENVFEAALEAGALGVFLSGAGPTVIALTQDKSSIGKIKEAMKITFLNHDMDCSLLELEPDAQGAVIMEK